MVVLLYKEELKEVESAIKFCHYFSSSLFIYLDWIQSKLFTWIYLFASHLSWVMRDLSLRHTHSLAVAQGLDGFGMWASLLCGM